MSSTRKSEFQRNSKPTKSEKQPDRAWGLRMPSAPTRISFGTLSAADIWTCETAAERQIRGCRSASGTRQDE